MTVLTKGSGSNPEQNGLRDTNAGAPPDDREDRPTTGTQPAPGPPRFLTARLGVIVLVTLVTVAGAAALSWSRPTVYRSEADVLVQANAKPGMTVLTPDVGTEKDVAESGTVLSAAARTLGVSESWLAGQIDVVVPVDGTVLKFQSTSGTPRQAQRQAQAVADAYVDYRSSSAGKSDLLKVDIVTPAAVPRAPAGPDHKMDLAVGVLVGLLLGVGVAFAIDRIDPRFHSPREFEQCVGAPLLATIPARRRIRDSGVVVTDDRDPPAAGIYRDLSTRVRAIASSSDRNVLLVAAPADEDATWVAANIAASLASLDTRVVLVGADLELSRTHEQFGLDSGGGLAACVDGQNLSQTLRQSGVQGLRVLPAGQPVRDPGAYLQRPGLARVMRQLHASAEYVIIDAPPILSRADAYLLAETVADMVLVVGDTRRSERAEVLGAMRSLGDARRKLIGCVLLESERRVRDKTSPARKKRPRQAATQPSHGTLTMRTQDTTSVLLGSAPSGRDRGDVEQA